MSTARRQSIAQLVDAVRVAVQDRGVEHRREQVVRRPDRMDVAGEVEVEVLHRHHLRLTPSGRAALDPEHRAERRFPQTRDRPLADRTEALREADERGRLAFAGARRRHARDADQLAVRTVGETVGDGQVDLGLEPAVRLELLGLETELPAISSMGRRTASCAISRLLFIRSPPESPRIICGAPRLKTAAGPPTRRGMRTTVALVLSVLAIASAVLYASESQRKVADDNYHEAIVARQLAADILRARTCCTSFSRTATRTSSSRSTRSTGARRLPCVRRARCRPTAATSWRTLDRQSEAAKRWNQIARRRSPRAPTGKRSRTPTTRTCVRASCGRS